ncbi:MAG TPA: twin-arginine translocation signal domain-containing protein, partial [Geobacteraceae bacterium]
MTTQSRRAFLKTLGVTGAGLLAVPVVCGASEVHQVNNEELGMLYDATKCVGCKACM